MEKKEILEAIKALREENVKRNFSQSLDLIINLKGIDLKREDQKVDQYLALPHERGKPIKVCAFVDKQLLKNAKENCDLVIVNDDFPNYAKSKKDAKKIANECSFFISQVNVMAEVAKTFGRTLGSRGKMPNPKAGCVVPGNIDLKPIVTKLKKTVRVTTRSEPTLKVFVGTEAMKDEDLVENIDFVCTHITEALAQGKNNIKNIILKFTMGKPYEIGKGFLTKKNESAKVEKAGS
ncbi:MAG: 50S ribosomal protein L1 [Candidatus Nanoarchaeia archaeon]|nr:50S ribosomal protein L1 [Candidatus Nanoarchaeia archaeon]